MLYIFNKTISNSKNILYSLTVLYGINKYQSKKICKYIGINPQINLGKLKPKTINKLVNYINKHLKVEQFLINEKKNRLNDLLEIKTNRGIRQNLGLPVRGQRTHTNAKTSKKLKKIFIYKKVKKNKKKNDSSKKKLLKGKKK